MYEFPVAAATNLVSQANLVSQIQCLRASELCRSESGQSVAQQGLLLRISECCDLGSAKLHSFLRLLGINLHPRESKFIQLLKNCSIGKELRSLFPCRFSAGRGSQSLLQRMLIFFSHSFLLPFPSLSLEHGKH